MSDRTYASWCNMKARCNNPNRKDYRWYGARGITYCNSWERYNIFLLDMKECPEGYTLERIDNDKNYSKENCKWIPKEEQLRNTRNCRKISFQNKTQNLMDWCRELNLDYETTRQRIVRLGWLDCQALTTPTPKPFKEVR